MSFLKNLFSKKDEPINSYADFWKWFQKNEKTFFKVLKERGDVEGDFFDELRPRLQELRDGYFFTAGMVDKNTAELKFTVEGVIKHIVFAEELVAAAPAIEGWRFTALKPELNMNDLILTMGECDFNDKNISFYSTEYPEYPDEIDITIVHHDLTKENKDTIVKGTYIFLDNYLGELNFATTIDNLKIIGKAEAEKELVPVEKLNDFLIWREKEFIEKYDGLRYDTENDNYSGLKAELKNGMPLIAVVNTDILQWDSKASHPWILNIEIKYDGENNHGMPDPETYQSLEDIENRITSELKDFEGYLNIARQTADGVREIYFACKDFRKPSKVMDQIRNETNQNISFEIYKDKYWQTFKRFNVS
jgi:hypothetical protein